MSGIPQCLTGSLIAHEKICNRSSYKQSNAWDVGDFIQLPYLQELLPTTITWSSLSIGWVSVMMCIYIFESASQRAVRSSPITVKVRTFFIFHLNLINNGTRCLWLKLVNQSKWPEAFDWDEAHAVSRLPEKVSNTLKKSAYAVTSAALHSPISNVDAFQFLKLKSFLLHFICRFSFAHHGSICVEPLYLVVLIPKDDLWAYDPSLH